MPGPILAPVNGLNPSGLLLAATSPKGRLLAGFARVKGQAG